MGDSLGQGRLMFSKKCADTLREFSLYRWNEKSGCDAPVKENDHAMDDIRYFVCEVMKNDSGGFFVASMSRGERK